VARSHPPAAPPAGVDGLTRAERDVLELVAAGLTNAEIAARLQLDGDAIDATVAQVLAKLGVRDRVHAVLVAYEARLIR
jgi:DNA-binding CsgD family transcriptional regulator